MKNTIRNTTDMIRRRLAAGVSWFALHLFAPSTAGTSNWVPREIRVHVESAVIASEAKWVSVAGSFNGWDPNKNPIEGGWPAWRKGAIRVSPIIVTYFG